ncbi:MAG: UDP-N-acetylglucosamine--N-acetylmuramyl-(pentapeptide) pyrophosphoryl-undecaprenol N-acetylglucosamine transferase [Candidatus Omnitrophica bacterium]|nr:UDP-N-acetylglucosamine--N-acetylmuramyl-(pentapeptide) pyrophosphoryl-undecaprenol N-acetylglucosamine transferase [Candidatus Omnitrophota bacterium]MCM8829023.1 UDP-N-acetylglucosamine--N-acetylmuramyl-(pentapeptide) pyrophosphoryl-undecaprenol N-acetylglucosamine transferase [Candidatus Omnitrophota bacterium]
MNLKTELKKKILIVVGSTGGHYFPGITLGENIRDQGSDIDVVFAGERKIRNLEIWEKQGLNFVSLEVVKRPGKKILFPFILLQATFALVKNALFISRMKPNLVVGMGSYTSVFVGMAALLMRKPFIVHEQNLVPGLANRVLNFFGAPAAITFKETARFLKNTIHTGLPLRKEMLLANSRPEDFGLLSNRKTVLVLGGSQGASFINNLVISSIPLLKKNHYQFIHIAGKLDYERIKSHYKKEGINGLVLDFSFQMPALMSFADFAIARAGAGTLAELSFRGIPSILIPYRYAGGHQNHNAVWAEKFGCITMEEQNATPETLINSLLLLEKDAKNRRRLFQTALIADTGGNLARYCLEIIGKR